MILAAISWMAVALGFAGTWVAGCCLLWLVYDVYLAIWAGAFAAVVSLVINTRNWAIHRMDKASPDAHHATRLEGKLGE